MSLIPLWHVIYQKYEGRCLICQIQESEGAAVGVFSIFQERQFDIDTFDEEELVLFCYQCRLEIQNHFGKGTGSFGVMKKYWRQRGMCVQRIEEKRAARKNEAKTR